jgi:branched-chain amino acid transport system substrate-binding protein
MAGFSNVYQEKTAEFQKILFHTGDPSDALTQKVLDDYDRYKYFFRLGVSLNNSINTELLVESIVVCREYTGFNKVAILAHDFGIGELAYSSYVAGLEEYDFDVVYTSLTPFSTIDFSSYFAQAEVAGAEIFFPLVFGKDFTIPFIKEYFDRQSPMVIWGLPGVWSDLWELTEGKCDLATCAGQSVTVGYPLTSKVLPTREAYFDRWGEEIEASAAYAYDVVRFILPDAIERAGTIETEAVIAALEKTEIETSLAKKIAFTPSHDTLVTTVGEDYWVYCLFQWQDGQLVPVYPQENMIDAGVSYMFPDWSGPWDNIS